MGSWLHHSASSATGGVGEGEKGICHMSACGGGGGERHLPHECVCVCVGGGDKGICHMSACVCGGGGEKGI